KAWVEKVGGFNLLLEKYNDDTELIERIFKAGGTILYAPRACVRHLVAKERLSVRWQIRRHYQEGVSTAIASNSKAAARVSRVSEIAGNLFTISKRGARLFISRASICDRIQRLAHL